MQIEKIPVAKLKAAEYNPRRALKPGDAEYEKLKRSITEFGYVEPVIWNKQTGNVVGGHQRLTVMRDLGITEIDCVVVELDPMREKALNVALNKIQGEWDKDKLAALLTEFDGSEFDVTLTGFDAAEVDELLNAFYSKEAVQDDFDVDGEAEKIKAKGAVTKTGDVWKLGVHRLMCGDSTSEVDFAKLMNGNKAQMTVTSPPYGVGKDYESKGIEPWFETMRPVVKNLTRYAGIVCWNLGDLYATGTQFIEPTNFYSSQLFAEQGFRPIWIRIWKKQGPKLRRRPLPSGDEQAGAAVRIHLRVQQKWRCGVQRSGIHVAVGIRRSRIPLRQAPHQRGTQELGLRRHLGDEHGTREQGSPGNVPGGTPLALHQDAL